MTLDEVVDHAVFSDGFLYCADELTYRARAGKVVRFAGHGPCLSNFAHLTSYEQFLAAFGEPGRVHTDETYGELVGYDTYYPGAQKYVRWDAWDHRVSLISLGALEESMES
ncbi:hypothetical protein [Embleya sp. NPDC005971]|uniref:hypothetical protein n=1 Tax=Embleya sp. NPDC005971 TaxID=3156724 RepID=UPI0033EFBD48